MELKIGQIVISKAGRDKGNIFVVFALEGNGEYALLVDGRTRLLERPKRKKHKHIQPTNAVDEELANAIKEKKVYLKNADFRAAITKFANKSKATAHDGC